MPQVIQGRWEDVKKHRDLHGRKVRVIVLDFERPEDPWLQSLRAGAESHGPLEHKVDDSRGSISSGTADDPQGTARQTSPSV